MNVTSLYRLLDAARVALALVVGFAAEILNANDVLHLPAGVTAALVGFIALAGQFGIRRKTTPDASTVTGRRSVDDYAEAQRRR